MIATERARTEHILVLDTGDALRGGGLLGDTTDGQAVVAAMNLVATDAMALGRNELSLGSAELQKRMAEARFPMLSANVSVRGSPELFAPPFAIVDIAGHRIALLGLTRLPSEAVADFDVRDPSTAVEPVLDELMGQVDTIILLTNMDYRSAMQLASVLPGIDLVVSASPGQLPTDAVRVAGTGSLVVAAEQPVARHTGRRVGRLTVLLNHGGSLTDPQWHSISLDSSYADDPDMATLLAGYRP